MNTYGINFRLDLKRGTKAKKYLAMIKRASFIVQFLYYHLPNNRVKENFEFEAKVAMPSIM
jgi:hypothetical protein